MQNNRAVWLAILVVAIASVVMIFFVLPQINGSKNTGSEMAQTAPAPTTPAVTAPAQTATQVAKPADALSGSELLQKMNRLKADAGAASESLRALYANGKVPTDAELADAKAKLQKALQAIADFKAPTGSDATVGGVVTGMSASAAKALSALQSMPKDAAQAADAASRIAALFSEKTGRKPVASDTASAGSTAAPEPLGRAETPTFDVLRVEKDGSTVIAGSAAPKAKIEVIDGDKPIGAATAGDSGDFAIVLDNPLAPGDHSLVLRTTGADGKAETSEEVATVSVPASKDGKLLAMVTKPGEASRILTKPGEGTEVAAAAKPEAPAAAPAKAEAPATATAPAAPAAPANALPPLPDASKTLTTSAPSIASGQQAPAPAQPAAAPAAADTTNAQAPADAVAIRIDAVEIEGDKIFVAGTTRPGTVVQVFADDKLIETTKSSDNGHFEAENTMPLSTGNHIIRADVMDSTGSKVVVRASVPFNRPAGDQVSVVADTTSPAADAPTPAAAAGVGQIEQMREEAAKALVLLKGLFADGKTPAKDQLAAATSASQIALKALSTYKPGADAGAEVTALAAKVGKSASAALKLLTDAGDDADKLRAAIPAIEAAAKDAMPESAKPMPMAESAPPASGGDMSAEAKTPPAPAAPTEAAQPQAEAKAEAPQSVEQAPLKESKDSVIIRKGDTLWQISRRVYGRGVRYTTIYLANQDQIDDPNKITPGQVFGVPDKVMQSDEDAEKANRAYREKH